VADASQPPRGADGPEVRAYWDALHRDLAELELRGALAGIRAVIAERLGQMRTGSADGVADPVRLAGEAARGGNYAWAAALLAAEIDRQETGERAERNS
jgi:hypothetical protein